jgi:hypothetical protein
VNEGFRGFAIDYLIHTLLILYDSVGDLRLTKDEIDMMSE